MDTRKRRKEVSGNRSFSLDLVHSLPKRPRVQAQRKFAQGAPVLPMSHVVDVSASDNSSIVSSCKSSIDKSSKDSFFGNKANDFNISPADGMESVEDLVMPVRPKTEDFLTFLCFRGTPLLPPSLDHFNNPPKPFKHSHQKQAKENDRPNIRARLSTDDSNNILSKENKAKQSEVMVEVRPNKTSVTTSGGLKSLKEKHSSRLLNARKKLLKRALELKSKSIRASRHCSKRLTRSSNVRRISPEKKISNSLERRERAERRQQLLENQEQDDKKQDSDKTVTRSKSFDYQKNREIPTLVRSRSTCQDTDKPNSLRIYRTQLSPATLAARKKAKLAIRTKPKVSRILMRLGAKSQSPNSSPRERATRSSTDQTDSNLSSETKKRSSSSEVKSEVKQEESEEERRKSTRALRMVRKEENVTFYARRSGRLPSHNSNADGDDVKPDMSQLSVTVPTPRARCNSGASNSSPYLSSCSSPSLSPKTNFSKRLQRATNEVPYRNTRQSHPGVKSDVTVRCVTPSREVMRCVRSAPPSRQSSPHFTPTIARRTRQSVDQVSSSNSGLAVAKTRSSSTNECSSKESFLCKNESSRSDTSDDSESLKVPKKQRNKKLTKRSERTGQTERLSGTRQLINDSDSSDSESEGPLQISTGGDISLLNSSIKTEIFSSDDELNDSLITKRKCIPVPIKNEEANDQASTVDSTLSSAIKENSDISEVASNPAISTCIDSKIQSKPTSISVLKRKVSSTRRRTSANPQENRLNEVLGSVAKDFGENIDESHYDKLETDLATGNKSPEKRMRRSSDKGADAKSSSKKNAGGKKLSEVVKNLTRKKISGESFEDQPLFLRGLKNIATATVADCKKQRQVGEVCDPRVNVSISTTVSLCTQLTTTTTLDTLSTTTTSVSSSLCAKTSKVSPPKGVSKNSRLTERKLPYAPIAVTEQENVKKPRSAPLFIPSIYDKSVNSKVQNSDAIDSNKVTSSEVKKFSKDPSTNSQKNISSSDAFNHEDDTTKNPSNEAMDVSKSGVTLSSSIFYGSGACKSSTANKSKFRATEIKIPLLPKSSLSITKVSKSNKPEVTTSNISITHLNIPKVARFSSSSSVVTLTSTVTATYLNSRPANFGPSGPIACASVKSVSVDKTSSKNIIEGSKSSKSSICEPLIIPSVSSYVARPLNQTNNVPNVQNMKELNTIQLEPVQQSIEGPNSVTNGLSFTNSGVLLPYTHQAASSLPMVNTPLSCQQIAPLPTIMTPLPANVVSLPLQQTYQPGSVTSINNSLLPITNSLISSSDKVLSNITPISSLIPFANPTCNIIPTIDNNNMMCTSSLVQATSSITPPIIYNTIQSYSSNTSLSSTHATSSGAPVAYFNSSVPYVAPTVVPQQGLTSVNTFLPQAPYTFVTLASQAVPSSISSINMPHQQSFSNELCPIIPIGGLSSTTPVTFQASPFPGQYANNQSPSNNQTRPILLPNAVIMTPQQNSAPSSPAKIKQINIAPKPNKLHSPSITAGLNASKAPSKPIQIAPKITTTNITATPSLNKLPQFISTPHGSHIIQTIPTIPTLQTLPQNLQSLQATLGSQFAFNQGVTAINNPIMTANFSSNQAINSAVARLPISANHHTLVGAPLPMEQTINSFSQIQTLNSETSSKSETHEITLNNTVSVTPAVSFYDQNPGNVTKQTPLASISSSIVNSIDIQAISSVDNNGCEKSIGKSISPQITLTSNIRGELPLNLGILNESSDPDLGNDDYELTVDDTVIESCDEDHDDESEPSSPPIPLLNSAELISKSSLPLSSKSVPDTILKSSVPNILTDVSTSVCTLSNTQLIINTPNVTSGSIQFPTSVVSTNPSYSPLVSTPSRSKHLAVFPAPMPRITRNAIPRPQPSQVTQKSNASMLISSTIHASPVNFSNNMSSPSQTNCIPNTVTTTSESKDVRNVSNFDKLISNTVVCNPTISRNNTIPIKPSTTVAKIPISIDTANNKPSICKVISNKDNTLSASTSSTDCSGLQNKSNAISNSTKTSKPIEAAVISHTSCSSETITHSTAAKSMSNSSILKPSPSTSLAVTSTNSSRTTSPNKYSEISVFKTSVSTKNNGSITISTMQKTIQGNNITMPNFEANSINTGTVESSNSATKGLSNLISSPLKSSNISSRKISPNETSIKPYKANTIGLHTSKPSVSDVHNSCATSLANNQTKSLGNLGHKSNSAVIKSNTLDSSKLTNPDTVSISREIVSVHDKKVKSMQSESAASKRSVSSSVKGLTVSKSSDNPLKSYGQNQNNAIFSKKSSTSQCNKKLSNSNLQNEKAFKPQFASSSVTIQPVNKMRNVNSTPLENQSKKEPVMKRSLFKTKSQEDIRSKNAFNVVNESSVYAFEPDIDSQMEENSRFSKRIKTTPTINPNSVKCIKQIQDDTTVKPPIPKGSGGNASVVNVTTVSKPPVVKLTNNSKPEIVKSHKNSTSEQPKRNSRTEINQKLRNSRASLHTLAALDQSSSESNSTSKSNSIQCSPITSPVKSDADSSNSVTKSTSSSKEKLQSMDKTLNPVNSECQNNSSQSQVKVAEKLVSKSASKNTDSNSVSTEVSKSSKATTSELKKGVEIAIQCDMDDPMTSFFRGGESGTQTEGPSRLPLPPSASPFYYLPLAMAALGEKLPAQLVQQMLAKTQGLVGAAEAGMILQQAAQLAQEHQAKVQQQGVPEAPLPEPPPVSKAVQSLSTSQQLSSKLTPEEAILVQTTPISADQQTQKVKQSKSKTVQRISHVPVVVAPTHLSTKSAAQAKTVEGSSTKSAAQAKTVEGSSTKSAAQAKTVEGSSTKSAAQARTVEGSSKITNASIVTFTHPVDKPNVKPSPPVYITPPTNRINPQIYAPKSSSGVNVMKSTTNTQTSIDNSRNSISEKFVLELSNKLLAVRNQSNANVRIKLSRSHSVEKESSNKKLKTVHIQEEKEKSDSENQSIAKDNSNNNKTNEIVERGVDDKMVTDAEEECSSKSLKPDKVVSKHVDAENTPKQNNAKTKSKADSGSKLNPAKKFKSKDTVSEKIQAADDEASDRGGSVRRSSRSSTSAATRATESDQHGAELMKRHRRAKKAAAALAFTDSDCMSPSSDSLPPPLSPQMSPDTLRGWPPPRLTSPSPSQSSTSSSTSQRSLRTQKTRNGSSTMSTTNIQSPKTGGKRLQRSSSVGGCSSNSSTVTSIGTSGGSWHPDPLIAEAAPPRVSENGLLTRAPSFFPSIEEFTDPLDYIEKIRPEAERFGICRIVPPASFRPECRVNDDMRFTVHNQYIHKLMNRWGPNVRTTQAIKRCLSRQNIEMKSNPLLGGLEVDLVQLYRAVETLGGLMTVLEQQLWGRVAQLCRIPKTAHDRVSKLDSIYCKYLLPYATLTPKEREMLLAEADHIHARVTSAVDSAIKEKRSMSDREESDDEEEEESERDEESDCLECFTVGKAVSLSAFYRLARNTTAQWLPDPNGLEVDERYWSLVTEGNRHVCVHEASIDTTEHGYGFPSPKNGNAKHQWNLKNLCQSNSSVLRSMGNVIGVTSPTLHVGMLFSSVCWYRDPHSLPWIEYIHSGASKIWYGVGSSHEVQLREAMKKLVPEYVKDSPVWLPADSIMVDPNALAECDVPVCRVVQEPGQFVIVFPGAFTSSLCTGYLIAESVFFAKHQYFERAKQSFDLLSKCGEPAMFSYERLVVSVSCDSRATLETLVKVRPYFKEIVSDNKKWRDELARKGVVKEGRIPLDENKKSKRKGSGVSYEQNEESLCEVCKQEQYLAMVVTDGRGEVYCLQHAVLNLKKEKLEKAKILYRHTTAELDNIVKTLDERIHLKTTKKALSAAAK